MREAVQAGTPLLGICYGHQLLAHALGGRVDYNPAGRESGTVFIDLHPPAFEDPLFAAMPARFAAHATHLQTVLRPPEGATVLARSEQDGCHAFRWGEQARAYSSTPNSPPTTCVATSAPAPTACATTAAARSPSRARSARRRRRAGCCVASSSMHAAAPGRPVMAEPRSRGTAATGAHRP